MKRQTVLGMGVAFVAAGVVVAVTVVASARTTNKTVEIGSAPPGFLQSHSEPPVHGWPVTEPAQAAKVDRVSVSLGWSPCGSVECATVQVPRNYDAPEGPSYDLRVWRRPAPDAREPLALLVGGPAVSVEGAVESPESVLPASVIDRYQIIGVEPRGASAPGAVSCFDNAAQQGENLLRTFPVTDDEVAAFVAKSENSSKSCLRSPDTLAASVSTSDATRDLDVVRRALGAKVMHLYTRSYSTLQGQMYANMFPDRVGKVVLDGVVDATHNIGLNNDAGLLQDRRLKAAEATDRAMREAATRCDAVGPGHCRAAPGATAKLNAVLEAIRQGPLTSGFGSSPLHGQQLADLALHYLIGDSGAREGIEAIADVYTVAISDSDGGAKSAALARVRDVVGDWSPESGSGEYDHNADSELATLCTDSLNPPSLADAVAQAREQWRQFPLGGTWTWWSVPCSAPGWAGAHSTLFTGPYTLERAVPMLVIGREFDPATPISDARSVAARVPGTVLVESDGWGHVGAGASGCSADAVAAYFLTATLTSHKCQAAQPFA